MTAIFTVAWTAVAYAVLRLMFAVTDDFEQIGIYVLRKNGWPIDASNPPVAYGAHMVGALAPLFPTKWVFWKGGGK